MKKLIYVLLLAILLVIMFSACSSSPNATVPNKQDTQNETTSQSIEALSELSGSVSLDKYYEAYWEEVKRIQSPPSESVIPDENTAGGVATAIFESLCPDLVEKGYVVQHVRYMETDDVWIVTFYPDVKHMKSFGGDWNIAFRKKDGTVIRIFMGE